MVFKSDDVLTKQNLYNSLQLHLIDHQAVEEQFPINI